MRPIEGIWAGVIASPTVTPTFSPTPSVTGTVGASHTPTLTPTSTPTPTPTVTPSLHSSWVAENAGGSWIAGSGTPSSINNYVISDNNNVYVSNDGVTFSLNTADFPIYPIVFIQGFKGNNDGIYSYAIFGEDPNTGKSLIYYSESAANNPLTWNLATMDSPVTDYGNWGQVAYWYNNNALYAIAARPGTSEDTYAYCEAAIFASGWTTYIPYANTGPPPTNFPLTAYGVCCGPAGDNSRFVLTASDGPWVSDDGFSPFSPSGTSWVFLSSLANVNHKFQLCAYGNGTFVISYVDISGSSPVTNFYTSPDGESWSQQTPNLAINGFQTFYYDSVANNFIGGVNNNNNLMYHSFDGINWFTRIAADIFVNALAGGVNGPVAVGFDGNIQRYGF